MIFVYIQSFFDWRPSNNFDHPGPRQVKKDNMDWEQEKELASRGRGDHRLRGIDALLGSRDSSPESADVRRRTPATLPRTKVTSDTSATQKTALENLRQRIAFSDSEEVSSTWLFKF